MNAHTPTTLETVASARRISAAQIARRVGISETQARNILKGRSRPNVRTAIRIAKLLNSTVERLWTEAA
jgi:DNA-binding XRE family transcriptional regulator